MPRMRWRPGLRPGPRWGAHDAPTDLLVGLGGGHPLPRTPIGASFPILLAIHHWEQGRQLAKTGPGDSTFCKLSSYSLNNIISS